MIVHLVEFRIKPGFEAEVVATLQHPNRNGKRPAGLIAHSVGRRMGHSHRRHVLACAWQDFEAWRRAMDATESPACLTSVAHRLEERRDSVVDVIASTGPSWEAGRVLRIYRAQVRAEDLTEWETRAQVPIEQLSGWPGLVAILVGPGWPRTNTPGGRTVFALSAWRDWGDVLSAAGGRIERALHRTELADLERPIGAEHYQLLDPPEE